MRLETISDSGVKDDTVAMMSSEEISKCISGSHANNVPLSVNDQKVFDVIKMWSKRTNNPTVQFFPGSIANTAKISQRELRESIKRLKRCGFILFEKKLGMHFFTIFKDRLFSVKRKKINCSNRQMANFKTGGVCGYCGVHKGITMDHIQPHSRGGKDTAENLLPSCKKCNGEKGNMNLEEYRQFKHADRRFYFEIQQ